MATGFGVEAAQDGTCTTNDDILRIIGAEYRMPGIVSGVAVVNQPDKMAYTVMPGAVVMAWGAEQDMKTMVPVVKTTVTADPNPGTTSRTDTIYVQQHSISADGDNQAVVGVTSGSLPARSIMLDQYTVPGGATTAKDATAVGNRVYTRPVGGQFGQIAKIHYQDTTVRSGGVIQGGSASLFFGSIWAGVAPSDRDVMVHFNSTVSAGPDAKGSTRNETGSVLYKFYLNGQVVASWERAFSNIWETKSFAFPLVIQKAVNTISYTVERRWTPSGSSGTWQVQAGGTSQFPGDQLWVMDHGVANL